MVFQVAKALVFKGVEDFYSLLGIKASQVALRLTPVVGGSIDVYELFTGKDIFTQRELSQIDKAVSTAGLGLSFLPVVSEATEVLKGRKFIKLGENIIEYGERGTRIIKGSADDILDTANRVNRSTSEGKILPVNLQLFAEGTGKANFGSTEKLVGHFSKHGSEFKGVFKNADEYLAGARDVMQNGTKVSYTYKDEIRTGYVRFMGNNSKGVAKFEFVGTNNLGDITTYHVERGRTFWKMLNGENVKVINPLD